MTWGHWLRELGHGVVTTEVENEVALCLNGDGAASLFNIVEPAVTELIKNYPTSTQNTS